MITLSGFVEKRNEKGTKYFENENGEVIAKECTKCGEIKGKKSFYKDRRKSNGLRASCKECKKEGGRKYYEENKERKLLYNEENKERYKEYYEENKERISAIKSQWG